MESVQKVEVTNEQFERLMAYQNNWLLAKGALLGLGRYDVVNLIEGKPTKGLNFPTPAEGSKVEENRE